MVLLQFGTSETYNRSVCVPAAPAPDFIKICP